LVNVKLLGNIEQWYLVKVKEWDYIAFAATLIRENIIQDVPGAYFRHIRSPILGWNLVFFVKYVERDAASIREPTY